MGILTSASVFSGFSVDDLEMAKEFYGSVLELKIEVLEGMGFRLLFDDGVSVFVYPKGEAHSPASFTVLNFKVEHIDEAMDALVAKGVIFDRYDNPDLPQDSKGVLRGLSHNMGPDIAWFRDPAGNVLSILQEK